MKTSIQETGEKYERAKQNVVDLLNQLMASATTLEKLKAKVGMANSLSAFLQLNEVSDTEGEGDDLLLQGKGTWESMLLRHSMHCT